MSLYLWVDATMLWEAPYQMFLPVIECLGAGDACNSIELVMWRAHIFTANQLESINTSDECRVISPGKECWMPSFPLRTSARCWLVFVQCGSGISVPLQWDLHLLEAKPKHLWGLCGRHQLEPVSHWWFASLTSVHLLVTTFIDVPIYKPEYIPC